MTHRLTFHIGYHKTATTWMQRRLFTSVHNYNQIADHNDVFRYVVQPHGLRFDPTEMQNLIKQRLKELDETVVPIISSEIISGHPYQGGHESDVYAERLAKIAPNARILISIRAQQKIIASVYMQYLLRGGTMPTTMFFDGPKEVGYLGFTQQHFEYDLLVEYYQHLFGYDNVHVVTQEGLLSDIDATAKRIADFTGNRLFDSLDPIARRPDGTSYPEYAAPVLRRLNHVQSSTLNPNPIIRLGATPGGLYKLFGYILKKPPISKVLRNQKPVSAAVRQRFQGCFKASNDRLRLLLPDLDLSSYD